MIIVILGSNGFVGQNLSAYFRNLGQLNDNLDQLSFPAGVPEYQVLTPTKDECNAEDRYNIYSYLMLLRAWRRPATVVNLAAHVGGIGLNRAQPGALGHRNLTIGLNVLEACRLAGVRLVNLGTVCSYPHTPPRIPFHEDDLWTGRPEPTNEMYGVAKKTIGLLQQAYYDQYGFESAYLIPTNLYGPHDHFDLESSHVIPALIRRYYTAAKENQPSVTLWGDGTPTREFLYVEDCCRAIRRAIDRLNLCKSPPIPINVGTGVETPMKELSTVIADLCGYKGETNWDTTMPNGQPRRNLDTTRGMEMLYFKAKVGLAEGLAKTVEWFKTNMETG